MTMRFFCFLIFSWRICLTILCCFLPYGKMNQPQAYICPLPLEPLFHVPLHPCLLRWSTIFELPASQNKFLPAIYFIYGNYIFQCYSLFILSLFPISIHKSVLYICVSLLTCKQVHQYYLSRFHICALVYDNCFSFSDLFHSV